MRLLRGGSCGRAVAFGPAVLKEAYNTTANGRAERIEAKAGEVAVVIDPGGPSHFTLWAIGTPEEVMHYIRTHRIDAGRRQWLIDEIMAGIQRGAGAMAALEVVDTVVRHVAHTLTDCLAQQGESVGDIEVLDSLREIIGALDRLGRRLTVNRDHPPSPDSSPSALG